MKSHSYQPPSERKKLITARKWYENNSERIFEEFERFSFEETHEALLKHLPKEPGIVLDVGAGTGRDAAGFANLGHDVCCNRTERQASRFCSGVASVRKNPLGG